VFEILQSDCFVKWFAKLRDPMAQARINIRIRRLSLGNPGDIQPVGSGVSELRIDYGPGYRIYYMQQNQTVFVLLVGGDKSSQSNDIQFAIELAKQFRQEAS
jgi:putative addiction module killer protein